jgi:FkbM family methyltransferase
MHRSRVGSRLGPTGAAKKVSAYSGVHAKVDAARRCTQELRNWPAVLLTLGLSQLGWNRGVLTVASRAGVTLRVPNHRLSRWPPLEILVDDSYRLRDVKWESPGAKRVVLDVGAHVGSFTCALASRLPGAEFICVEPLPSALGWLHANLKQNGLTGNATVMPVAVARTDGEARLWSSDDASTEASLDSELWASWHSARSAQQNSATRQEVKVRTMSFDSIVAASGGPIDIVKLDCEGGEYNAILEATSSVWTTVEHLFLEYHPLTGHNFSELAERLTNFGLRLIWQQPSPRPGMGMAYFARAQASSRDSTTADVKEPS